MKTPSRVLAGPFLLAALALAAAIAPPAEAATPVRCMRATAVLDQSLPMTCTRPDESTFVNVPAGHYLYVTDILLRKRAAAQIALAGTVQLARGTAVGAPGCNTGSGTVTGELVAGVFLEVLDTNVQSQVHLAYQVPYLVLTEFDCLAVYTSASGGTWIELSGLLSTSPSFGRIRLSEVPDRRLAGAPLLLLAALRWARKGPS